MRAARSGAAWAALWGGAAGALIGLGAGCDGVLGLNATTLASDASQTSDTSSDAEASAFLEGSSGQDASEADASEEPESAAEPAETGSDATSETGPADAATPVFTISPDPIGVHPASMVSAVVSVVRNGALTGNATVTFTNLPTGVTATPATLGADAGAVGVTLTATSTAPSGFYTIALQANGVTYATVPLTVYGAPGTVDSSFQGGYVPDSQAGTIFNAVAVDSQGRIVAGGSVNGAGWILRRFLSDGTVDTAFDTAAAAAVPNSGSLAGLTIDPATNNIIAVGGASNGNTQISVAVVSPAGTLAGSFNAGNLFELGPADANNSSASAVVVATPGAFVFAANVSGSPLIVGPVSEASMPTWGSLPKYTAAAPVTSVNALAKDSSGKIVAAGATSQGGPPPSVALQRFNGITVDATFAFSAGVEASNNFGGTCVTARAGGAIFVAGGNPGNSTGGWAQWSSAGACQWAKYVGNGGGGTFSWPGCTTSSDQRVYVVGYGGDMYSRSSYIDRVAADGTVDSTFGGAAGVQTSDPNSGMPLYWYVLKAVTTQADGLVIVAGQKTANGGTHAILGRYWP